MRTIERIRAGYKASFSFSGFGGWNVSPSGWNWPFSRLPGAQKDYAQEAGNVWLNGAVSVCLNWILTNFPEAPGVVSQANNDGTDEIVQGHPLSYLISHPNPYYAGNTLWAGTCVSYWCNGNAYWFKERTGKRVTALWYVPHFMVEPRWDGVGKEYITHYDYFVNGRTQQIDANDVVHFRFGIDPENVRKVLSTLGAPFWVIVSANYPSTYVAAILKNFGVPGVYISPGTPDGRINDPDKMKRNYMARTTGDKRGEPIIFVEPANIQNIAMSPEQLALDKIRNVPEARICGAMRVPAMVVGLTVSEGTKTYANYKEAREAGWEECLIPTGRTYSTEIDIQLLSDFSSQNGETFGFDYRKVRALQTDMAELYTRVTGAVQGPWLTPNEGRKQAGLADIQGGDVLYPPKGMMPAPPQEQGGQHPATPNPLAALNGSGKRAPEEVQTAARGFFRRLTKDGDFITLPNGHVIYVGEEGGAGGGQTASPGQSQGNAGSSGEKTPNPSAKSQIAKQNAKLTDATVQRYSEEHNEPILAKGVGGVSLRDNEPVDVVVLRKGTVAHGIELKTMTNNANAKITMSKAAMERKAAWVKEHGAAYHTVVFDDHKVFNANGPGKHGDESQRTVYYRRGYGSFRVANMHPVKDMAELGRLMDMPSDQLPAAARPPAVRNMAGAR